MGRFSVDGWENLSVRGPYRASTQAWLNSRNHVVQALRDLYGVKVPNHEQVEITIESSRSVSVHAKDFVRVEVRTAQRKFALGLLVGEYNDGDLSNRRSLEQMAIGAKTGEFFADCLLVVEPVIGRSMLELMMRDDWQRGVKAHLVIARQFGFKGIFDLGGTAQWTGNVLFEFFGENPWPF